MRVKKTILILLFALIGVNAWAEDSKIIVWLNDGSTQEVSFEEMPQFVYADGMITLKKAQEDLSWPLANLKKFTFVSAPEVIPLLGDANGDGKLTADDIVEVVNKIKGSPSDQYVPAYGDANGDGIVNAADIVVIVNLIMNK